MNILSCIVDSSVATRLTLALLHFLWQGCCGGLVVVVCGVLFRGASARFRYNLNVVTLILMAACLPVTFRLIEIPVARISQSAGVPHGHEPKPVDSALDKYQPSSVTRIDSVAQVIPDPRQAMAGTMAAPGAGQTPADMVAFGVSPERLLTTSRFQSLSRWVAILYLSGVALILGRLLRGVWGARRLRQMANVIDDSPLLELVNRLARRLGLKVVPAVAWCGQISIPVVVGIVKPMILLPIAVVSGFTPDQLQALLLHELAHIRRFDPIVNLLQRIIEAVLFFHPVVWFVSRRISVLREHAADDLVLTAGCDRPAYADALLRAAELASAFSCRDLACRATVLAASGTSQSEFKLRVLRLVDDSHSPKMHLSGAGMLALLLVVALGGMFAWSQTHRSETASYRSDRTDVDERQPDIANVRPESVPDATPIPRLIATAQPNDAVEDAVRTIRQPAFRLPGHWSVMSVGFDNDDSELVTASTQNFATIRRWDVAGKKLISEIKLAGDKHGRSFREGTLMLSGDRRRVIAATDDYVGIWETATGKLVKTLPFPKKEWEYDCIGLLACTSDLTVIVGTLATTYERLALVFDAHTIVWDGVSGKTLRTITHKNATHIVAISLSPDGKRLATTNGVGATIWDTSTGQQLLHVPNDNKGRNHFDIETSSQYTNHVWSVQFSPSGKQLAMGDILGVKLVDTASGKLLQQLEGPYRYSNGQIRSSLVFSKDGQLLARLGTGDKIGEDGTSYVVPIWSTQTGQQLFELATNSNDGAFSDDGQRFVVGFSDLQMGLAVWQLSGASVDTDRTDGPGPESRQDKVEENGHYRGKKAAEFIDTFKPTWSEAKLGIQYGIALTKPKRHFQIGQRVPLGVFFRNANDTPLKIDISPDFFGNPPRVLNAQGAAIELEKALLLGTIPRYVESLEPGEAVGPFYLNFGLGENPRPGKQNWHPYIKTPIAGPYKLTHTVSIDVVGLMEGDQSKNDKITSPQIEFEIVESGKPAP